MHPHEAKSAPPVQWCEIAESVESDDDDFRLADAIRDIDSAALDSVRRSSYFASRRNGKTHRQSVKASNSAIRKVARILGYSYPASHELSF